MTKTTKIVAAAAAFVGGVLLFIGDYSAGGIVCGLAAGFISAN